jgi:hypothetical protein
MARAPELKRTALKIVRLVCGVAGMQRGRLEFHSRACGVLLGNVPGNDHGHLLNALEFMVRYEFLKILRIPHASGGGHAGDLAKFIEEGLFSLTIHALPRNPEAERGGNDEHGRNGQDDFLGQIQILEHLPSPLRPALSGDMRRKPFRHDAARFQN